jgi:hypothetical protein
MHNCSRNAFRIVPTNRDAPTSVTNAANSHGVWPHYRSGRTIDDTKSEYLVINAVTLIKWASNSTHRVISLYVDWEPWVEASYLKAINGDRGKLIDLTTSSKPHQGKFPWTEANKSSYLTRTGAHNQCLLSSCAWIFTQHITVAFACSNKRCRAATLLQRSRSMF